MVLEGEHSGGSARAIKPRPNHGLYVAVLRAMTSEERLLKALELSRFTRDLFLAGLRRRYPDLDEAALRQLYLRRLAKSWDRRE